MRAPLVPPEFHCWPLSDGYALRGRIWRAPDAATRPPVLYLHGIQSHGGWFEWSASLLAQHGACVALPDRRGSGLNSAQRGDVRSAGRWLADVSAVADWLGATTGQSRVSLVGVSWGGKLAAAWAARYRARVAKLLLIAPGIYSAVTVPLGQRAAIGCSALLVPQRRYEIPLSDPALFTDNPTGRAFIAADPLRLTRATARFLFWSTWSDTWVRRRPRGSVRVPTTLLLAERERIIDNSRTTAWLRRVTAGPPPIVRVFSGAAHTLEFEPDTAALAAALTEWANS
jgi:alpha-beta hydrolase superfamily lysophospholipase